MGLHPLATKSAVLNKVVAPIISKQSKLPIVGKKSVLFGNSRYTSFGRGLLNGRYGSVVKIGWSNNAGNLTFRVGLGKKMNSYGRVVSRFHIDYGRLRTRF